MLPARLHLLETPDATESDKHATTIIKRPVLFARTGDPDFVLSGPEDEDDAIALSYTSGTTGNPKGVVAHHRGAVLNAMSMSLT